MSAPKGMLAAIAAIVIFSTPAMAASSDTKAPKGRPPGPPAEAVAACADLSEGDACSFTGRNDETLDGECHLPPAHGPHGNKDSASSTTDSSAEQEVSLVLACMPAPGDMPPPPNGEGQPPQDDSSSN